AQLELLDLAGRGLGDVAKHHVAGHLETREVLLAVLDDVLCRHLDAGAYLDEGAWRFAPFRVRPGDHGGSQHGRVAVEHIFHLDGRDVFAPGNDDVLAAVLDLDVTVGVHHSQVARVEPAAGKGLLCGLGILQVALHGDVAAEHDLAHGLPIGRHRLHGQGVHHRDIALQVVAHALARIQAGAFPHIQVLPVVVLDGHRGRTIDLGQAVDVREVKAHALHAFDHGGRRGGACHHGAYRVPDADLEFLGRTEQPGVHDGSGAVVRDPVRANGLENGHGLDLAQAHVHAGAGGHRPGEAPAIAVEHGQGPQIDRVLGHVPFQDVGDGIDGRAAVVVDHALGVARRARGVVQAD